MRPSRKPVALPSRMGELALSAGMMGSNRRMAACSLLNSSSLAKGRFRCVLCRLLHPCPRQSKMRLYKAYTSL